MKIKLRMPTPPMRIIGLVTTASVALAGCGALRDTKGRPLTTLAPKARESQVIDNLITPVFWVAGVVFVLVELGCIWFAWRYRARKGQVDGVDDPVQLHGNPRLEWGWTIAPALLLAFLAIFNVQTIWDLQKVDQNALKIEVIGQQWWWEFRYDTNADGKPDIITAQQMVVPLGRQVEVQIKSNDVIHSFWIPALNGKKDAVPGRTHTLTLEPHEVGIYEGQCTEFCGLSHAFMRMEVKVLAPADYQKWVEHQLSGPAAPEAGTPAAAGAELVASRCLGCHQVNGLDNKGEPTGSFVPDPDYLGAKQPLTSGNAPNLTHLMSRNRFAGNLFPLYEPGSSLTGVNPEGVPNAGNLQEWLKNPPAMKPMAADQNRGMPNLGLSPDEIFKIVAYLTSLK